MRRPHWRRHPKEQRPRHAPAPPPPPTTPPAKTPEDAAQDRARRLRRLGIVVLASPSAPSPPRTRTSASTSRRARSSATTSPRLPPPARPAHRRASLHVPGRRDGRPPPSRLAHHRPRRRRRNHLPQRDLPPQPRRRLVAHRRPDRLVRHRRDGRPRGLGEWKATHNAEFGRVPRRLWLAGPHSFTRSWRATLRMHRTGHYDYRDAFSDLDLIDAAIRLAIARRAGRRLQGAPRVAARRIARPPPTHPRARGRQDGGVLAPHRSASSSGSRSPPRRRRALRAGAPGARGAGTLRARGSAPTGRVGALRSHRERQRIGPVGSRGRSRDADRDREQGWARRVEPRSCTRVESTAAARWLQKQLDAVRSRRTPPTPVSPAAGPPGPRRRGSPPRPGHP
jgi:hypothetical protein